MSDEVLITGVEHRRLLTEAAMARSLRLEVRWLLETGTSGEHETVDPDEWERRKDTLIGVRA